MGVIDVTNPEDLRTLHEAVLAAGGEDVDVDVLVGLAATAVRNGDLEGARSILEAALVIDPEHAGAWALAGVVFERLGRTGDAETAFRTALDLDESDHPSALSLAELLAARGERDRALSLLNWLVLELEDRSPARPRASELRRRLKAEVSP